MSEQKRNPLVSLVRKAVGLPSANSGCCGSTGQAESSQAAASCCGPAPVKQAEPAATASSCCGSSPKKLADEGRTVVSESTCC